MVDIEEIQDFKTYLVDTRHSERVNQQTIDQKFFEDKFDIPHIKKKEYEIRSGFVAEMSNAFTQQLISSIPKVYVDPKMVKGAITKEKQEGSDRLAKLWNQWCYQLGKQSHNPFKQTFKYLAFNRGESWIYIPHKPELAQWKGETDWQDEYPDMIPTHFLIYDPLVMFSDPSEDIKGKPSRVVVSYKRLAADIYANYPMWSKYKDVKPDQSVDFLLYVDKDQIYAEAEKESLFREKNGNYSNGDGRRNNLYKCLPFVHTYSGFGVDTENHAPELLAYSRTRMIRGKIEEDAAMASDFSYNMHAFAFRHRTFVNKSGVEVGADAFKEYHPDDPAKLSILNIPAGSDIEVEETQLFDAPVFAYRQQVKSDLMQSYPSPLKGQASGSSGRQEDILSGAALSFYDCVVENNSTLWAQAFEIALKVSSELDILPAGLKVDDIKSYSKITVNTKRDDPLESLRAAADGDRKYQLGIIDLETNLIEYQHKTKEEAKQIMARLLVDDVTRNHPVFRELMGMTLAQEMGVVDQYMSLSQGAQGQGGINPTPQFGSQGGQPREGNIKTQAGREQIDMSGREPRRAPVGV